MELIGYGNDPSSKLNYWKLKNSWGSGWGQQGFLYIVRKGDGPGLCGVQA
jgi:cathepsin L